MLDGQGRKRTVDAFDEFNAPSAQNMNVVILGASGSGKSDMAKSLIVRQITQDVRVYVIDPEGEYVDACVAAGGRVLTLGTQGEGFDSFVVPERYYDMAERIEDLFNLLRVMLGERLELPESRSLYEAVASYYEEATIGGRGTWAGLFSYLDKHEKRIAVMLRPFYDGSKQYLLSDEGADLLADDAPVTVFDLRRLDDEVRGVAGIMCVDAVWRLGNSDPRRRKVVIDEAWSMLRDRVGASFMLNVAKRARKHFVGITTISQDVQDLLRIETGEGPGGNIGRALIQNASHKVLLRQDIGVIEELRQTFGLPDEVAAKLSSYAVGQGLLITPRGHFPMHIEASKVDERSGHTQM